MKLKKIVSLALAGILAVSMLTACGEGASSSEPTNPVEPVDTSFATAVNAEMGSAAKNVLTFGSDSKLATALEKMASKIDSVALLNGNGTADGFVTTVDAQDFRSLLDIGVNNGLTYYTVTASGAVGQTAPTDAAVSAFGTRRAVNTWNFFKNNVNSSATIADLIVVPGNLTETGLAKFVAEAAEDIINADRLPLSGTYADGKDYRYAYTGNIAVVKVNNAGENFASYVIGLTITQTATEVTNVN